MAIPGPPRSLPVLACRCKASIRPSAASPGAKERPKGHCSGLCLNREADTRSPCLAWRSSVQNFVGTVAELATSDIESLPTGQSRSSLEYSSRKFREPGPTCEMGPLSCVYSSRPCSDSSVTAAANCGIRMANARSPAIAAPGTEASASHQTRFQGRPAGHAKYRSGLLTGKSAAPSATPRTAEVVPTAPPDGRP